MTQTIQNVSDTAFMVAQWRAMESERPEPLFRDPLAAKLAGEHGRKILETIPVNFVGSWSVAIRTVIIDDLIEQAIAEGVDTILNLGAGLDTRPYRIDLPKSLRWVEVDYPHVIALKDERLAGESPSCSLDRVNLDLTDRAARRRFLADVSAEAGKILVLTEGVIPYLTEANVAELAADLKATAKVRYWIVDYFSPEALRFGKKMRGRFMRNAPFQFTPRDWFGFFRECGWQTHEIRYISEEAERLGRPIPLPLRWKLGAALTMIFISPERREQRKRFAAYALLVRA
jgi:methyltransferase (TIGR00027 family)